MSEPALDTPAPDGPARNTVRALTVAVTVDAVGSGMYVPFSLVFFRHVTGLPLPTIGLVLTVTGLAGMAALPLSGGLVDRYGARRMQLAGYLVRGLGFCLYPLATTLPVFVAVALLTTVATRAFPAVQQALIGQLFRGAGRDRFQSLSRSLTNGGLGAGTLLAAALTLRGGRDSFVLAAWLNAASFFVAGLVVFCFAGLRGEVEAGVGRAAAGVGGTVGTAMGGGRVGTAEGGTVETATGGGSAGTAGTATATAVRSRGGLRTVAADRPFLGLTFANLLIALGYSAPAVLLPIYCVTVLHISTMVSSLMFAINTAMCAFLGVPVGRLARRAARRTRTAAFGALVQGLAFAVFAVIGAGRWGGPAVLAGALAATMVLYTVGELMHSPASSVLALAAAPAGLRGRYLATYQLSWSLAAALAPSVFTALLDAGSLLPWLFLIGCAGAGAVTLVALERSLPEEAVALRPADGRPHSEPEPAEHPEQVSAPCRRAARAGSRGPAAV